jgi:hypothetical protein
LLREFGLSRDAGVEFEERKIREPIERPEKELDRPFDDTGDWYDPFLYGSFS